MKLFTQSQLVTLRKNGEASARAVEKDGNTPDHIPVIKLFTPDAQCTWLITEIQPGTDDDIAFGLCDLGMGEPEIGSVSLAEIRTVRGALGLLVERDLHFLATKTLREYALDARRARRITA